MVADLETVWRETRGDVRICIAVIDGPVDLSHPCFRGAQLTQLGRPNNDGFIGGPAACHGMHVASTIFGQGYENIQGTAPDCRGIILPIFLDGDSDAAVTCNQLDLARAILQAVEAGAQVINISGGQHTVSAQADPLLEKAIKTCIDRDVLIVAAAGNDGCACIHIPAAISGVLAVGAMDDAGHPIANSNWGQAYGAHSVLAPGWNVLGAAPNNRSTRMSGTSCATPFVAGLAGLLLSAQLRFGARPSGTIVRSAILRTANPCRSIDSDNSDRCLGGRVNPVGALQFVQQGGGVMTDGMETRATVSSVAADVNQATALNESTAVPANVAKAGTMQALRSGWGVRPSGEIWMSPGRISPSSDCACGGGANCTCGTLRSSSLVYALGKIGYDFGSEARRDSFVQAMPNDRNNPHVAADLAAHLTENPFEAEAIIWTLNLDATPIYAIQPSGPFASITYQRIRESLEGQLRNGVELVSLPGVTSGNITLLSGQVVPVVIPAIRGIYAWSPATLVRTLVGEGSEDAQPRYDRLVTGLSGFLNRVYFDMRNLGFTAQERALNYSATNAFQVAQVFERLDEEFELDDIVVKKSSVCRPDSDCYDVELSFFTPGNTRIANKIFQFTVDVSDIMPVTIGEIRTWSRRP